MAAPPPAVPNPPQVTIPVSGSAGIGNLTITPPRSLKGGELCLCQSAVFGRSAFASRCSGIT